MKKILLIALVATFTAPVFAERFINFTDADGKRHKYELAEGSGGDDRIVVSRPNGSSKMVTRYEDGKLAWVSIFRPDWSTEADITYRNGKLWRVATHRPYSVLVDPILETGVIYENGELDQVFTLRPDGSNEAAIAYEDGELVGASTF